MFSASGRRLPISSGRTCCLRTTAARYASSRPVLSVSRRIPTRDRFLNS